VTGSEAVPNVVCNEATNSNRKLEDEDLYPKKFLPT
jgi:hypothetical protein